MRETILKIKQTKKIYIIIPIILLLIISTTYGRYIFNDIKDAYLASKSFYFNSDKLTPVKKIYQIDNWSGIDSYHITINLNNSKNNLLHASSDILYDINYTCSSNATCSVSKNEGIIYSEQINDYFNAIITPNQAMQNNEQVWMEISATSSSPYKKKISARFVLKVGIPGISFSIDDVVGRPYFELNVTNTTDYYLVKEAFGIYNVNQRIDHKTYMQLSEEDKQKCALPLITLEFNPMVAIIDSTSIAYQEAENITTTNINGHDYVNSISFRIALETSEGIKFYKANANENYTYPIINNNSIVNFSHSQ